MILQASEREVEDQRPRRYQEKKTHISIKSQGADQRAVGIFPEIYIFYSDYILIGLYYFRI